MKKRILFSVLTLFLLFLGLQPVQAQEGFTIDHYDIQIEVSEDGVYTVTETLDVQFQQRLHGLNLTLPKRYRNVTWRIGDTVMSRSYVFPIDHVEVLSGHEAKLSDEDDYYNLRLGSADTYAQSEETYQIRYQVHTRDLRLGDIQSFYWNLISVNWDTTIEKVTFRVTMPKSFDASQLYFYSDLPQDQFRFEQEGTTFSGETLTALAPFEGITVKLDLPDQYFIYPKSADYSLPLTLLGGLITLFSIFCLMRWGRDEALIVPVEFTAPEGISSTEVGMILNGSVQNREVLSLILDWANRGYLTIEDQEKILKLNKLMSLPEDAPVAELRLFNALFKNRDSVTTKQLEEKFYTHLNQAIQDYSAYYRLPEKRLFTRLSSTLQVILTLLAPLPIAILAALQFYAVEFSFAAIVFLIIPYFVMIIVIVMGYSLQRRWHSCGGGFKFGMCLGMLLLTLLWAFLLTIAFLTARHGWIVPVFLGLCTLICAGCAIFMKKRTDRGQRLTGRVLGLRNFILYAEKDRLAMLVEDDPTYFYSILPYAYALGLSDIWAEHFRGLTLEPPTWYYGPDG
ncbi:DUF2207 domain-containing protein, partial [Holdemania filiformis]